MISDNDLSLIHISWKMTGGQFGTSPSAQSVNGFIVPFQGMTLSANGTQPGSGVLWVLGANEWPLPGAGQLHAYNADTVSYTHLRRKGFDGFRIKNAESLFKLADCRGKIDVYKRQSIFKPSPTRPRGRNTF